MADAWARIIPGWRPWASWTCSTASWACYWPNWPSTKPGGRDWAKSLKYWRPANTACSISAANWRQIWVPRGFAHGLLTLEPDTEVLYKVDGEYNREADGGIAWNDPALGIDWPLPPGGPTLSDKDAKAPLLAEAGPIFPRGSW